MTSYSKKFHIKRDKFAIYPYLATAVSRVIYVANIPNVTLADFGSSIGYFLKEFSRKTNIEKNKLVGVDFGRHVKKNYADDFSTYYSCNLNTPETKIIPGGPFSVITSWEMAEHLDEANANSLISTISKNLMPRGLVIFGAAKPHQRGTGHVNCQPPEYWHEKFAQYGLKVDTALTQSYREELKCFSKGLHSVYFNNAYCLYRERKTPTSLVSGM